MRLRCRVDYMILVTNEVDGFVSTDIKTVFIAGEVYEMIDRGPGETPFSFFRTPLHYDVISLYEWELLGHFYTEQETRDILIQDVLN